LTFQVFVMLVFCLRQNVSNPVRKGATFLVPPAGGSHVLGWFWTFHHMKNLLWTWLHMGLYMLVSL